jgi:hypothetical protein
MNKCKLNLGNVVAIAICLVATTVFSGCDKEIENGNEMDFGIGINTQYYWSGGQKIWLDTDSSVVIVMFDNEQNLDEYLSSKSIYTASKLRSQPAIAVVQRDKEAFRELKTNNSVVNMAFGNLFHNTRTIFWLTREILLEPKEGISAENIKQELAIDCEIVRDEWIVVIRMNNWNTIFDVANAIYESGMVNYCHPDFWTTIIRH